MEKFQQWHRFATEFSENLFYDDILLDRWSNRIFNSDGAGARLKELADLFSNIAKIRREIVNLPKKREKGSPDEEHLLDLIGELCSKHEQRVMKFFSGEVTLNVQKLILALALDEASPQGPFGGGETGNRLTRKSLMEKIRDALIQMHKHDAEDPDNPWADENLKESTIRFGEELGYPEEAIKKVSTSPTAAGVFSILVDYSTDFEAGEISVQKKTAEVKDAIVALQPDEYEERSVEEWAAETAKSLDVSPEYVMDVLMKHKKEGKESGEKSGNEPSVVGTPRTKQEQGLSKGAAFGLDYLSLYTSPLIGDDPYWYIKQYAKLGPAQKKEQKNDSRS